MLPPLHSLGLAKRPQNMREAPLDQSDGKWPPRVAVHRFAPVAFDPDMIRWYADV